jgi:hypothetical protein
VSSIYFYSTSAIFKCNLKIDWNHTQSTIESTERENGKLKIAIDKRNFEFDVIKSSEKKSFSFLFGKWQNCVARQSFMHVSKVQKLITLFPPHWSYSYIFYVIIIIAHIWATYLWTVTIAFSEFSVWSMRRKSNGLSLWNSAEAKTENEAMLHTFCGQECG